MNAKNLLMGVVVTATMALSGWCLNAVANMPKEYVSKDEFKELRLENREDHKEILEVLRKLEERQSAWR